MTVHHDPTPSEQPTHKTPRRARIHPWASAALVLVGTCVLVYIPGIELREWAAALTFVVAHLVAAEVVMSGHRPG
jgi:hypothetical protein